jgi:AbrB family looped-hinge helix DNA binding protein
MYLAKETMVTATATLSSRGQIVIPAKIRKLLNLKAGDRIKFSANADGKTITIEKVGSIKDKLA